MPYAKPSDKSISHYYCQVCDKHLKCTGGVSDVNDHGKTVAHEKLAKSLKTPPVISEVFYKATGLSLQVKHAEIKLAAFATEHDLSFNIVGPLVTLLKNIFPDSAISQKVTCERTKCTKIVTNVIGKESFNELVNFLKVKKFSLLVDESTDISGTKYLAVLSRFFDGSAITDRFLALIPVADVTAANLYQVIKNFFVEQNIPYKLNMIGYG